MSFSELVDIVELRGLCESFTQLTGAVTAILDIEGNVLVSTGWQDICTKFHRKYPQTASRCRESDTFLAGQLASGKTYNIYHCKNGLVDVAVPIVIDGSHVANFFTGQFFFKPPDREYFIRQADEFGFDKDEYLAALDRVPIFSEDYICTLMDFFTRLTGIIGRIGYSRRRLEETLVELRASEERFSLAMDATQDGLWDWDIESGRIYCSPGYVRMLGYDPEEMSDNIDTWRSLVHEDDSEMVGESVNDCICGKTAYFELEFRMKHKDGGWRWILGRGSAVTRRPDGQAIRMLGTHTEITDRVEAEEKVRQMEKMNAIGQLAGGIAHDFNNQLGGVMGYAEMLCNRLQDPELKRYAEKVLISSRRAGDLTSKLLAFARKGQYQSVAVDMHEVIHEVVGFLNHSIAKTIVIKQVLSASPSMTRGDPTQLQNALLNLAINAADSMTDGGDLVFDTGVVSLDAEYCSRLPYEIEPGSYLRVCISDTGCGIPKENLSRIFEPFFTTKDVGKGTGMGLAAVYGTVKQHKGAINVYSEVGHGTTFKLFLPVEHSEAEELIQVSDAVLATGDKLILVIDDEEIIRELGEDMLSSLGYRVMVHSSAESGIECYRNHWHEIDLVVLDMVMPGMSGPEVYRVMKAINPEVKVLLASGYSVNGAAQGLLAEGVQGFIQKPFARTEMSVMISDILDADSSGK